MNAFRSAPVWARFVLAGVLAFEVVGLVLVLLGVGHLAGDVLITTGTVVLLFTLLVLNR